MFKIEWADVIKWVIALVTGGGLWAWKQRRADTRKTEADTGKAGAETVKVEAEARNLNLEANKEERAEMYDIIQRLRAEFAKAKEQRELLTTEIDRLLTESRKKQQEWVEKERAYEERCAIYEAKEARWELERDELRRTINQGVEDRHAVRALFQTIKSQLDLQRVMFEPLPGLLQGIAAQYGLDRPSQDPALDALAG